MAHNISIVNGIEEAAFALKEAWHGLGVTLENVPDSETMLQAAHLDWEVGMNSMDGTVNGGKHDGLRIPSARKQIIRLDTMAELGTVSGSYGIVQNREAFQFLDNLIQDGIMRYESAGALKGGSVVWVLARMPEDTKEGDEIAPGDYSRRYVLFQTSHDGSMKLHCNLTATRVVCWNTLSLAIRNMDGIRHKGDMKPKLDHLHKFISQFSDKFTDYRDNARKLATARLSPNDPRTAQYLDTLFPPVPEVGNTRSIRENKVAKVRSNRRNQRNNMPSISGTWWSLYNSVTELVDHQSTFRGKTDTARAENRMLNTTEGDGAAFKSKAFDLALAMSA